MTVKLGPCLPQRCILPLPPTFSAIITHTLSHKFSFNSESRKQHTIIVGLTTQPMAPLFLYRNGDAFIVPLEKGPRGGAQWATESLNAERAPFPQGSFHKGTSHQRERKTIL